MAEHTLRTAWRAITSVWHAQWNGLWFPVERGKPLSSVGKGGLATAKPKLFKSGIFLIVIKAR